MCRLKRSIIILLIASVCVTGPLFSQQTSLVTANALRLDLRVLGHPPKDVIPPDESAITSLVFGTDGRLYGGTTGEKAHLFVLDPQWGHVVPLGFIPGEKSIFHSLAPGLDNSIYIGTSLPMTGRPDARGKDVAAAYSAYEGGHLYRFDAAQEANSQKRMQIPTPQRELPFLTDLGIPVTGEGIISLVRGEGEIYGMTFPNGHFFVCDLETGKIEDKGVVCGAPLHEEPFKSVPRALVIDTQGRVWGARDRGAFFHYDPEAGEVFFHNELRLPSEWGREYKAILDAAVLGPDGTIYGGTSDGFIFRLDPDAKTIVNLGKPQWQYRIRGLAFSRTGALYGIGGDRGGAARLFVYNRVSGGYENLGLLDVNRMPYYAWTGFEADSMVVGPDGTIFIGESGRISHLFLLYPWH